MQKPCLLTTINKIEFVKRKKFPAIVIAKKGKQLYYYLKKLALMQNLLIPFMSSDIANLLVSDFVAKRFKSPSCQTCPSFIFDYF